MGEIINLRQARKRKVREAATADAATNRARFGQPKAAKRAADLDAKRLDRTLDGAKRGED